MKFFKYKYWFIASFAVAVAIVACKKSFLDRPPQGTLNPEIVATEPGIQGILIGAYSLLDGNGGGLGNAGSAASNWVYGGVSSDDAYKGSDPTDFAELVPFEQFNTLTPSNGQVSQKWRAMYIGAQRSNDVIRTLAIAQGIAPETATALTAQARFLRAFYHFELKRVFNNIIYADETVNSANTDVTNTADAWPRIEEDLQFAVANLPETWSEVGRVNKWAATALLAKVYMQQAKHTDAYPLLKEVIANGKTSLGTKYALHPYFFSNFNPAQQKTGAEAVFQAQTSVKDNSSIDWGGDPNGNYGDILNFPYTGGPGACCGFYNPSQDLGNAFKTDGAGLPLLDESYAEGANVSARTSPYTGNLDPRIDWTMGRPGIPYLDWGPHPGESWIRNPANNGRFSPIKNVYAQAQKDAYTDQGGGYWAPNELVANNVNLIRFADVILMAAECAAKAGEIPAAMDYVNMIRARAANPDGWVYKNSGYDAATSTYTVKTTPADNYRIALYTPATFTAANAMTAVRFERRLELAMEGHRFFDLQRYDKDSPGLMATVINRYIAREKTLRPLKQNAQFQQGKNEYFPINQNDIDNMNADGTVRLVQNPGY
jgi:hypothetical protein